MYDDFTVRDSLTSGSIDVAIAVLEEDDFPYPFDASGLSGSEIVALLEDDDKLVARAFAETTIDAVNNHLDDMYQEVATRLLLEGSLWGYEDIQFTAALNERAQALVIIGLVS